MEVTLKETAQDTTAMTERRQKIMEAGFQLFAEHSIETVKLQDIATASGIGIATLYRYFGTKADLAIAIAVKQWQLYYQEVEAAFKSIGGEKISAAEELEFFLDCFIELYRSHKDVLRFNRNFDTYVKHEGCNEEQMRPYNEAVSLFADKFHRLYMKSQNDGTLDIRFTERKFFLNLLYIMISVAGKYAEGLIYPCNDTSDKTEELIMLKHIILNAYIKP